MVVAQLCIYLPSTLMTTTPPHNRARYAPYLLPDAISVASENSVITLTTPSDSPYLLPTYDPNTIHVLKEYVPLKGRVHRGYCCMKHGRIRWYKKTRLYCSTCSDEDKKFYYCLGFSKISLATRTCFLEHQHSMSLRYSWLLSLSPFHHLPYLLNFFVIVFFLFQWSLPILFLLTVWMHVMTAQSDI